jgi:hypothetical protein
MDPVLAELYGTLETGPTQEEIEKTAQLQMLQKVAEAYEIDLTQLTDEQILEAASELEGLSLEKEAGEEEPAEELSEEELVKQAELQDLAQNSDYGGRIFAHAMIDELKSIQKAAEEQYAEQEEGTNPLLAAVQAEVEFEKEGGARIDRLAKWVGGKSLAAKGIQTGRSSGAVGKMMTDEGKRVLKKGLIGAGATTAATGAGVGIPLGIRAAKKKKKEKAMGKNAFDEAVFSRAAEHLAAAGLVTDEGDILPPDHAVKTAHDIDAAALHLLEEMGYPVEWNEG